MVAMLFLTYMFLNNWSDNEKHKQSKEDRSHLLRIMLPNRIQALERMVLFLQRISPEHIVPRLNQSGLKANELQFLLINEINTEFEHNLSQQLYIPNDTWRMIVLTKDQIINEINTVYNSLKEDATSKDLALGVLNQNFNNKNKAKIEDAISMLKKDLYKLS